MILMIRFEQYYSQATRHFGAVLCYALFLLMLVVHTETRMYKNRENTTLLDGCFLYVIIVLTRVCYIRWVYRMQRNRQRNHRKKCTHHATSILLYPSFDECNCWSSSSGSCSWACAYVWSACMCLQCNRYECSAFPSHLKTSLRLPCFVHTHSMHVCVCVNRQLDLFFPLVFSTIFCLLLLLLLLLLQYGWLLFGNAISSMHCCCCFCCCCHRHHFFFSTRSYIVVITSISLIAFI